jgi:hypothetical protein
LPAMPAILRTGHGCVKDGVHAAGTDHRLTQCSTFSDSARGRLPRPFRWGQSVGECCVRSHFSLCIQSFAAFTMACSLPTANFIFLDREVKMRACST